ncbi:MAG: tripartite tricarboxylate transporter substrate binding protein [Hyphomicrobiaceae bacterium]|nr:tripartite tricarboxylate transporter substrate binding protein [Hyphomicrobiaceae bacterium]
MIKTLSLSPRHGLLALALALVLVGLVSSNTPVSAQWVPSKQVDFIVMAGKGGGADQATRFLIDLIEKKKLSPVKFEVVNMPADSGAEALATLKKRAADPHVLLFTLNSFYTTPLDRPQIDVDISTFAPVARMAEDVFALWVHSDRQDISTIDDFVKAAKAKGKNWIMAGTGKGAEDNLLTDFLNAQYGLQMTYQAHGGGGEVARLLAEKKADSTVNNPSEQKEFFPKGITKPLLTFTPARLSLYPAQPTLRETGMDFTYKMQRSVVGAPGLAPDQVVYWQNLFRSIHATPEWQQYASDNSLSGNFVTGTELTAYWVAEREKHVRWKMALELLRP